MTPTPREFRRRPDRGLAFLEVVVLLTAVAVVLILTGWVHAR